ncbi:MAG TPA: type II toxin-antitoxin system Phd/YefM family antitoxin [Polyangia bacterium]
MTKFSDDVHPVSDLRRKAHELVGQARRSGRPVLITQRGRGAAILVSVEEWERREERQELLEAILKGERDFDAGRIVEKDEALGRIRAAARPRDRRK